MFSSLYITKSDIYILKYVFGCGEEEAAEEGEEEEEERKEEEEGEEERRSDIRRNTMARLRTSCRLESANGNIDVRGETRLA